MEPNQTLPPPQQNNYDFILNPGQAPKKPAIGGGNGMMQRLLIFGGGAVILIIVVSIAMSLLRGGGNSPLFLTVAAEQQEMLRVSDVGLLKSRDSATRNFVTITKLTLTSDKSALLAIMKTNGIKTTPQQLLAKKDSQTDAALSAAEASNRLDEELVSVLKEQLTAYMADLKKAHDATAGAKTKQLLSDEYDHAETLVK